MGMAVGGKGGSKAEINMTPMIDVLLVLIIIFMVITPLAPAGLRALVPQPPPDAAEHEFSRDIVVTVERDGSMLLNAERIELLVLPGRLSQIYRARGDIVLFVHGD